MNCLKFLTFRCAFARYFRKRFLSFLIFAAVVFPWTFPAGAAESPVKTEIAPSSVIEAVKTGDLAALKKQLGEGVSADAKDKWGSPLVSLAAQAGHEDIVRLLLEQGASPANTMRGSLPLHFAAEGGNTNLVVLFLEKGNPINATMEAGMSVLYFAVKGKHHDAARLLLERGADANLYRPVQNVRRIYLPLSQAIANEDRKMVELLIKHGADFNALDNIGIPAYFEAARISSSSLLKYFLGLGAEPDRVSQEGSTPLMWAAAHGSLENVRLLVSKNVQADRRSQVIFAFKNDQPLSARDMAVKNGETEVAAFLEKQVQSSGKAQPQPRIHFIK